MKNHEAMGGTKQLTTAQGVTTNLAMATQHSASCRGDVAERGPQWQCSGEVGSRWCLPHDEEADSKGHYLLFFSAFF